MLVKILKGKLHRATVTDAKLHYPGRIEIDSALMEAAEKFKPRIVVPDENNNIKDTA
jgi:aspartate 1-decarboxylase